MEEDGASSFLPVETSAHVAIQGALKSEKCSPVAEASKSRSGEPWATLASSQFSCQKRISHEGVLLIRHPCIVQNLALSEDAGKTWAWEAENIDS